MPCSSEFLIVLEDSHWCTLLNAVWRAAFSHGIIRVACNLPQPHGVKNESEIIMHLYPVYQMTVYRLHLFYLRDFELFVPRKKTLLLNT